MGYNICLGDALHRRERTLKNSEPTMIKSRPPTLKSYGRILPKPCAKGDKTDQNINANEKSYSGFQPNYAFA